MSWKTNCTRYNVSETQFALKLSLFLEKFQTLLFLENKIVLNTFIL